MQKRFWGRFLVLFFFLSGVCLFAAGESIFDAAESGDLELVQKIVKADPKTAKMADPNRNGNTPLHVAARFGQKAIVAFLLANKADPNAKDEEGWTPLHLAAYAGFSGAATLLIDAGASLDATCVSGAPLHAAIMSDHLEMVEFLLSKGAKIDQKAGDKQWTPLHSAAYAGGVDIVKFLVNKGADYNEKDTDGRTAKDLAASRGCGEIVGFLRDKMGNASGGE